MKQSLNEITVDALIKIFRYGIIAIILALTIAASFQYKGHVYIFVAFSLISNTLLYIGFRKNAIYFDTFIGVLFWLGFWLKSAVRIYFAGGHFYVETGDFNGSGAAFDYALLVATTGMLGLIFSSFVREKLIFSYPKKTNTSPKISLEKFYQDYRSFILIGYAILILAVAITNFNLGIYQRGEITRTTLPMGLNGVYKWLLLFGLASFSATILRYELLIRRGMPYLVVVLSLLESLATNVSMLSRGMLLNVSALAYGTYGCMKNISIKLTVRFVITFFILFIGLFASSIIVVNHLRYDENVVNTPTPTPTINAIPIPKPAIITTQDAKPGILDMHIPKLTIMGPGLAAPLFLDRWVGIEGVMAISSNSKIGWSLWQEAWREKYSETTMSFYDSNLIWSPYNGTDFTKKHSVSMPGILAFFFYPGSFIFLFVSMLLLGIVAALIEMSAFMLSDKNLILSALIAEVVAYRFASFGYVPAQSYLLFGTIFLNLFIIYLVNKLLRAKIHPEQ